MATGGRGPRPNSAAVLVIFAVLAAASCAHDPEETGTLRVGTYWGAEAAEALQEELQAACAGLEVSRVQMQVSSLASLYENLLSPETPGMASELDLALVPNDWLGTLAERRVIGELPAAYADTIRTNVISPALLAVSHHDRIVAYPIGVEALALVYNPRFWPSEPRYLDDMLTAHLPEGVVPFSLDLTNVYQLAALLSSFQSSVERPDGSFTWDAEAVRALFRSLAPLWADPQFREITTAADVTSLQVQLFAEGRLASFLAGPWLVSTLRSVAPTFAVAPVPAFRHAPFPPRPLVGYQSLVVIRRSPAADLAHAVANRLLAPPAQVRLALRTARQPVLRTPLLADAPVLPHPILSFARAVERGEAMPSSSRWEAGFRAAGERIWATFRSRPSPSLEVLVSNLFEENL